MDHILNKSLFIILPNLTCFFWEKNRHFILVHLVFNVKSFSVERFNRTLKNDIWKMLYTQWQLQMGRRTAASRVRLQRAQASHHRPADVTPAIAERLLDTVYSAIKIMGPAKFKVGNSICVSKYKTIFEKVTRQIGPSRFIFVKVQRTNSVTYLLDYREKSVAGTFYA